MSDRLHHNCNLDSCQDTEESVKADSSVPDPMELIHTIPDHCLKASTTMQGTITDPGTAERIRKLIKELKVD